jgi:hypothetical protein
MNTRTKSGEANAERHSPIKEPKNGVTENVKITLEDEPADLSKAEGQLILNHGAFLYNLCS